MADSERDDRLTPVELDRLIQAIHEADGVELYSVSHDFESYHHAYLQKLHAMACNLAGSRGRACLSDYAIEHAVLCLKGHWAGLYSNRWRPSYDLTKGEWADLIDISHRFGIRGMKEHAARYMKKTWIEAVVQ